MNAILDRTAGPNADESSQSESHESELPTTGPSPGLARKLAKRAATPTEVAHRGFRGPPREVPHRTKMEVSFGRSFAYVKAYVDANAVDACAQLGAHAYAVGDQIAFASADPDEATVAHELAHVLGHGEGEAEAAEAAVASGARASCVVPDEGTTIHKAPARKDAFSTGFTATPDGFQKDVAYSLWTCPPFEIPIPAVPGLFAIVAPGVSVSTSVGVDWSQEQLVVPLTVAGSVSVGFQYGTQNIAALYGTLNTIASGGFEYTKGAGTWSLLGSLGLSSNFSVGCKIAGGILDYKFEFGHVDPIASLASIGWTNGAFSASGLAWGPRVEEFFGLIRQAIDQGTQLVNAGIDMAKGAYNTTTQVIGGAADFTGNAFNTVWTGAANLAGGAANLAGDAAEGAADLAGAGADLAGDAWEVMSSW